MNQKANKTCLESGVRVLTKKMENMRSVCMGVWVNVGARDETPNENGLSHFIEHMIFKGTERRDAFQIAKEFDRIGGHTNAFTSMENTCYHAKVMDTQLATMVDILSDIFLHSVFDPREIKKEQPVILQEIGMVEDSPDEYIHQLSGRVYWGDNPLGRSILGTPENVIGFNTEAIKRFFSRFYQPKQILITAAGNIAHEPFVDIIQDAFEFEPREISFPQRVTPPENGNAAVEIQFRELEQTHFCIGLSGIPLKDPRRYAASLMSTILGGNMSSRLFQQIRENKSLAYSVYSFMSSYMDTGMIGVYGGVDTKRSVEAVELTLAEINSLKKQPVTKSELENAKEYTKGNILLAAESNEHQMARMAQNEILFGRDIPIEVVVDKIDRISEEDILDLARELFDTDRLTLTLLGPIEEAQPYKDLLNG